MSTQLAPPAAATLSRPERTEAARRARRGRSADAPEPPLVRRERPPTSADELERQAQQIIRDLDAVECDVRTTPYPVNNGLRKEPVRRTASGQSATNSFGSLDRVALRTLKNNKNGVKSRSTNTLPTSPHKGKIADADVVKNNLIKAESLKRGRAGQFAGKKVGDLVKPIGGSTQHLNNVNLLKDEAMHGRHRRGSEAGLLNGIHRHGDKVFSRKYEDEENMIESPRTLHHPIKRLSSSDRDSFPRVVDSASQTQSGFSPVSGGEDVIYTQVVTGPGRARPEVPPRPERAAAEPYRPRGFSYISRRDADLIERAQTVEDRSRYIIEKIARQRSRSPAFKSGWTSQRVSASMSPPPPVLPAGETGEVRRGRYGSSIVQIGGEDTPPPRPPPPVEPPHYVAPRNGTSRGGGGGGGGVQQHYSVPRRFSDNVIRLSVSGSHTSSGDGSPTERRRSQSHEATPPPPLRDLRSQSSSPERYFYGMSDERRQADQKPARRVSAKRPAPRRPSREPSVERHRQLSGQATRKVNGHATREISESRDGARPGDATTLERARRREDRAAARADRPSESPARPRDNKKKIKIKFIYDSTRDEPSDARLAKYTEYRGSDEAGSTSPTPPPPESEQHHKVVQIDVQDGHRLKQEKMLRQRDKFLAHFLESGRPEPSERQDGRRISPGQQSYDKDLHGVWSSLDEEDQIIARQQRSEKNVKRSGAKLNNGLHNGRDRQRSSLSSEDDRPRRPSRDRSASPERAADKPKKRGWLSSTLSRLDFKSRRHTEARRTNSTDSTGSGRPVERAPSQTGPRPPLRRQTRSASRDSRSGSREPATREAPRRPPGRTPSFSQRYFGESDGASGGENGRRPARRPSGGGGGGGGSTATAAAAAHSVPSSVNSSDGRSGGAAGASRVSSGSGRSVFLHATTVADIPPPGSLEAADARGSRADLNAPLPARERRKVARSFSLVAPFRPRTAREKEIVYENQTGQANGRPPRPPQRLRRGSRDSLLDEAEAKKRQPVARSVSMPKDARPAGFFRSREKTPR